MQKDDINILIVDDDPTMGKALKEAVSRAGFKAQHVMKPDEALSALKLQTVHAAVIDCMLPKMNGTELAKKIRSETSPDLPIFLMSGIFKDKNFAREAVQQTGAISFLTKPFDLSDLISSIESRLDHMIEVPLAPLYELLAKHELSHKERIKAVNDTGDIHGFDLPWIFSILMHSRVNGHLNIITADGGVCGVGFQKGQIVQVNQKDSKSYFGVLMVEYGFISQAEIDETISNSGKTKKLGEQLVDANLLSPHAIQIVMAEQQGIRLSSVISDTSVKVNFIEDSDIRQDAIIERTTYIELMNEWLLSKVTLDWLKDFYLPWMRYNLKEGPEFSPTHRSLSVAVVQRVPNLLKTLLGSDTLEHAFANLSEPEDHIYRALHALVASRVLRFGEQKSQVNYEAQKKRLEKLDKDLSNQNYFERLGLSSRAKDSEIKRAYHEVAKILHPDKLGPEVPEEVRNLARQAFSKISEAYETLSHPESKSTYLTELEKGRTESILRAEQLAEQARSLLTKGDFKKARGILEQAVVLAPPTAEVRLLHMWSKMKAPGNESNSSLISTIRDELSQVPPEDRHNALFYFVKGLHLKLSGELENARRSFEHVLVNNPDFIDARRELNVINLQSNNKPVDILRGDLKDVVGMLFRKRK